MSLVQRYKAGETVASLALSYEVSENTIRRKLKELGVPVVRRGKLHHCAKSIRFMRKRGDSLAEIAVLLGCSKQAVHKALQRI